MFLKSDFAQARRRAVLCGAAIGSAAVWAAAAGVSGGAHAQPAPGSAPDQKAASAKPQKPDTDPGDKVICRYEEETGSRLGGHKICHTKREWEQMRKDSAEVVSYPNKDPGRPK